MSDWQDQVTKLGVIAAAVAAVVTALIGVIALVRRMWRGLKGLVLLSELLEGLPEFIAKTERFMPSAAERLSVLEKSVRRIEDKVDASKATVQANTGRLMKVEATVGEQREARQDDE